MSICISSDEGAQEADDARTHPRLQFSGLRTRKKPLPFSVFLEAPKVEEPPPFSLFGALKVEEPPPEPPPEPPHLHAHCSESEVIKSLLLLLLLSTTTTTTNNNNN